MPPQEDNPHHNVSADLVQMREQLRQVAANVNDIKDTVANLISLDKTIAELAIYSRQNQDTISKLWERHDQLKLWQSNHESATATILRDFTSCVAQAEDRCIDKITSANNKVDEWVNRGKGAAWVLACLGGILQITLVGMVVWMFQHVNALEDDLIRTQTKMEIRNGKP